MKRYNFNEKRMEEIIESVTAEFVHQDKEAFSLLPEGFNAYLHYMIFSCRSNPESEN